MVVVAPCRACFFISPDRPYSAFESSHGLVRQINERYLVNTFRTAIALDLRGFFPQTQASDYADATISTGPLRPFGPVPALVGFIYAIILDAAGIVSSRVSLIGCAYYSDGASDFRLPALIGSEGDFAFGGLS